MTENEILKYLDNLHSKIVRSSFAKNVTEKEIMALIECKKTLKELKQYHSIGTVEELRQAAEKQSPKKPIMKPFYKDINEEYLCCPTCGDILTDRIPSENKYFYFHCLNCGQKFLWED